MMQKTIRHFFGLMILLIITIPAVSADVLLMPNKQAWSNFEVEVLADPDEKLSWQAVQSSDDWAPQKNRFNRGYDNGIYWYRFSIANTEPFDAKIYLQLTSRFFQRADLFQQNGKRWSLQMNGLNVPFDNRQVQQPEPTFLISIPRQSTPTFYLRTQSDMGHFGSILIFNEAHYLKEQQQTQIGYWFILASTLFLFVYSLYLTFRERQMTYLCYAFCSLFFVGWAIVFSHYFLPLWQETAYYKYNHYVLPLAFLLLIRFSQTLLKTASTQKFNHLLLNLSALAFLVAIFALPVDLSIGFEINHTLVVVSLLTLFGAGVSAILNSQPYGLVYTLSLCTFILGLGVIKFVLLNN